MHKPRHHLVILCTLLGNVVASTGVLAEQAVNHDTHQNELIWAETTDRNGFMGHVPTVDTQQLAGRIEMLRDELLQQQQDLARKVEETRLDAGDAIITVIMPGGLLYAGYRKRAHSHATNDLAAANEVIEELTRDLAASRSLASTVAQLN
ncbi:MAG: hypothetical protein OEN52_01735 [Gammaproteobacteria bacterium]|nr:hypothetical protein [Gammaproteobacteria bacterium]MDH3559659.1 hypothetical protein [Gammaproteobacteria bacterium]